MARPHRPDPDGGWHHVMNRGVNRETIFYADIDRHEFGRLLGLACDRFDIEVHSYCLMTNHFHLLLRCPRGDLSAALHFVCSAFARFVNNRTGRVGHLFGDRFTSRLLTTEQYIVNTVRYIHRNPLDIPGVSRSTDYRWSSHRTYLGFRRPPEWLKTSPILDWFTTNAAFARFVDEGSPPDLPARSIDPPRLLAAADSVLAERSSTGDRTLRSQRRALALLAVADGDSDSVQPLFDALGIDTAAARRTARWRAHRFRNEHPDAADLVARVRDLVAPHAVSAGRAA